jgi:hypothetical protein
MTVVVLTASAISAALAQQVPPRSARPAETPVAADVSEFQEPAQAQPRPTTPASRPAVAPEPSVVEEKGFKGKVFELKYREPSSLARAIRPLGSGFKGATVEANSEFKTITVRDFPENIAAMEEAIKRLDVKENVLGRPDIEFFVHVLIASNSELPPGDFPPGLNPVIKQLQTTLRYKNYGLMTSSIHRTKERVGGVKNSGVAESKLLNFATPMGNPVFYQYSLDQITLESPGDLPTATAGSPSGGQRVQIGSFIFSMRIPLTMGSTIQYENVGFQTPVAVREGEKVVVGTTSMGDKGLIVVLSAKVIK